MKRIRFQPEEPGSRRSDGAARGGGGSSTGRQSSGTRVTSP